MLPTRLHCRPGAFLFFILHRLFVFSFVLAYKNRITMRKTSQKVIDSDSVIWGSNPYSAAMSKTVAPIGAAVFCFSHNYVSPATFPERVSPGIQPGNLEKPFRAFSPLFTAFHCRILLPSFVLFSYIGKKEPRSGCSEVLTCMFSEKAFVR